MHRLASKRVKLRCTASGPALSLLSPSLSGVSSTLSGQVSTNKPLVELVQARAALFRVGPGKPPTGNARGVPDGPALVEKTHQESFQQAVHVGSQVLRGHLFMAGTKETHRKAPVSTRIRAVGDKKGSVDAPVPKKAMKYTLSQHGLRPRMSRQERRQERVSKIYHSRTTGAPGGCSPLTLKKEQ